MQTQPPTYFIEIDGVSQWTDTPDAARILATYDTKAPFRARFDDFGELVSVGKRHDDLTAARVDWAYRAVGGDPSAMRAVLADQPTVDEAIAAVIAPVLAKAA